MGRMCLSAQTNESAAIVGAWWARIFGMAHGFWRGIGAGVIRGLKNPGRRVRQVGSIKGKLSKPDAQRARGRVPKASPEEREGENKNLSSTKCVS
jgi:hypothetical protein